MALLLSRRVDESVLIGNNILVTVRRIKGNQVQLAFTCPPDVRVLRTEIYDATPPQKDEQNDSDLD